MVVVSYNSSDALRDAVSELAAAPGINPIVVDNSSTDASLESVADLPLNAIALETNNGFAYGCNIGWRAGAAPYVLFLNPDARISPGSVERLAQTLDEQPDVGIVGPLIRNSDGSLDFSQRRFPRLTSTYARALFIHHLLPRSEWVDEMLRDPRLYERPRDAEWLSGACLLVRRSLLETLGGWDDGFFLYCEDKDLCKRCYEHGFRVRFEPSASCTHEGGGSAPRTSLQTTLMESRLRYAHKHGSATFAVLERLGLVLASAVRTAASRGGGEARRAHARALAALVTPAERRSPGKRRATDK